MNYFGTHLVFAKLALRVVFSLTQLVHTLQTASFLTHFLHLVLLSHRLFHTTSIYCGWVPMRQNVSESPVHSGIFISVHIFHLVIIFYHIVVVIYNLRKIDSKRTSVVSSIDILIILTTVLFAERSQLAIFLFSLQLAFTDLFIN